MIDLGKTSEAHTLMVYECEWHEVRLRCPIGSDLPLPTKVEGLEAQHQFLPRPSLVVFSGVLKLTDYITLNMPRDCALQATDFFLNLPMRIDPCSIANYNNDKKTLSSCSLHLIFAASQEDKQ